MLKYVEICLYSGPVLSYDILSEDCASSTSPLQVLYAYYIYIYTYYYLCVLWFLIIDSEAQTNNQCILWPP